MLDSICNFFKKVSGGRPMTHDGYAFTDVVSGRPVHYWRDLLGRRWMAERSFSLFRIPRKSIGEDR